MYRISNLEVRGSSEHKDEYLVSIEYETTYTPNYYHSEFIISKGLIQLVVDFLKQEHNA